MPVMTYKTAQQIQNEQITLDNEKEIQELNDYLSETDWYVTRLIETEKAIPQGIVKKRQDARDRISELKGDPK